MNKLLTSVFIVTISLILVACSGGTDTKTVTTTSIREDLPTTSMHTIDSPAMTKTIYQTSYQTQTSTGKSIVDILDLLLGTSTQTSTPPPVTITTTTKILHPITLEYSFSLTEQIGQQSQASPDYIYLIVHLHILNLDDLPFVIRASNFKIEIENVKYTRARISLDNELKEVELLKGGNVSGDLVFEVQNIWSEITTTLEPEFDKIVIVYEQ